MQRTNLIIPAFLILANGVFAQERVAILITNDGTIYDTNYDKVAESYLSNN